MYTLLIIVHVFVCLVLICVVLLQAGRGGGLSDMMGGGQPQSIFGTQTNEFMTKATEVCAVVFIITSLSLGILSSQRGKSLVERRRVAAIPKTSIPALPKTEKPPAIDVSKRVEPAKEIPGPVGPAAAQATAQAGAASAQTAPAPANAS